MAVSYIRLWKLLLDKRLKRVDLKMLSGISSSTLAKLGKDEYVSMESMDRICKALNCRIEDIMEFIGVEQNGE
ncbi:MAG: helix-turn-helix transcriptional regulator [bacterium]|nr:helix-turn-helix transcriptional regulator [bacterium]